MVSQPRSGITASAHVPKTASPEANRPPNRARATTDRPTVRRTGHSQAHPARRGERPSEERQAAERGQRPGCHADGIETKVRARVMPAAATTTPTRTDSATTPPAARSIGVVASTAASTAQARVQGWRRMRATDHMSAPAASSVSVTASPTLRSGHVRAAQAPTASAAEDGRGCAGQRRARARSRRASRCSGPRAGRAAGVGRPGRRAPVPSPPRRRAGGGRCVGPRRGLGLVGVVGAGHGRLLLGWVGRIRRGRAGAGSPAVVLRSSRGRWAAR